MNCIIVHGSPSKSEKSLNEKTRTYDKHWIPWIKKELEKKGIKTNTPLMPEPWEPEYKEWKKVFEKNKINKGTILVGHSTGGGFLVRWLGETGKKAKKLILVAQAIMHSGNYKLLEGLLNFKINKDIKNNICEIVIFVSNDDSKGIKESVKIFSKALNINPVNFKGKGHFIKKHMETEKFPELLDEILKK